MNTARRLARLSMIVATLAAAAFTAPSAGAAEKMVRLDTVVITGHRGAVERTASVQLPTVSVIGRRPVAAAHPVRVFQLPTVVVTGQRSPGAVALLWQKNGARGAVSVKSAV